MPHKLWIYPKVVAPKEYRKFLSNHEGVASAPNTIKFEIKNIGKETFPGGEIVEGNFNLEFYIGMSTVTVWKEVTSELPTIQPDETFFVESKNAWFPLCPGLWRLTMKVKSKDNVEIEYYQSPKGPPRKEEWLFALYAVDRHQLDLTLILKQFLDERRQRDHVTVSDT